MKIRGIITGKHTQESIDKFRALDAYDLTFAENVKEVPQEVLAHTEVLAGRITPELLAVMPKLRYVQLFSAGATGYAWLPDHVRLMNAYGAFGDSIAEHMLATTMMAMKRLPEYLQMQERQGWELLKNIDRLEGSRVLSVGMGAIGTAYLKKVTALGAIGYGVRRTVHDVPDFAEKIVTLKDMDELLPQMDVVALSLPGTAEVEGLFDERRLRLIKRGAILVNTGRGNSVVTEDLIRVMNDGHLKAACLDVMDPEPLPKDHPLWTTPGVYITPHISGGYRAGVNYSRVVDAVVTNLRRIAEGAEPLHIVDKELGY